MGHTKYDDNNFSCEGKVNITEKDRNLSILIRFVFNNGTGIYTSKGNFTSGGQGDQKNQQKNQFYLFQKNDGSAIISFNSNQPTQNNANSSALIHNFFIFQEKSFIIKILRQSSSGYLFSKNDLPLFYCVRAKHSSFFW